MPTLHFLEADQPLTKTFSPTSKSSYPNVYEVSSHNETMVRIDDLVPMLKHHGKKGRCLLKGALSRPLSNESRAGSTNARSTTEWLCLDLDGANYPDTDAFMGAIGLSDVSYVRQWSASSGLTSTATLRCHLFVMLSAPASPNDLKRWLQALNLNTPALAAGLTLTSTYMALKWSLDVTTCQNDKLIYIAPPKLLGGLVDPHPKDRYELVPKPLGQAVLPSSIPTEAMLRLNLQTRLDTLREQAGLPNRRKWTYKSAGGTQYLNSPDTAEVTAQRRERGFVYFNLNGGDSWAYYHPENNPYFIHNFKGEPVYRTQDLLPDYWSSVARASNTGKANPHGIVYLGFRDMQDSSYYTAMYTTKSQSLFIAKVNSEKQVRDFLKNTGQIPPETIPDWWRLWDPDPARSTINLATNELNQFTASEFMKKAPRVGITEPPELINRIVSSAMGDDKECVAWFYNWQAYILQRRKCSGVALVCSGTQGTGKGVLFHDILTPIYGEDNVTAKGLDELESEFFSSYVENRLLVMIDEAQTSSSIFEKKINAKLKTYITDPKISARRMYQQARMVPNYANFILNSNKLDPVDVSDNDRRYTIATPQNVKLELTDEEFASIPSFLEEFYSYLMTRPVDSIAARKPLDNAAKRHMIALNRQTIDTLSLALRDGDLQFFVDALPGDNLPDPSYDHRKGLLMREYALFVEELLTSQQQHLTRDELLMMCRWCIGSGVPDSPHKFTSYLRHHGINVIVLNRNGRSQRGVVVPWVVNQGWLVQTKQEVAPLIDRIRTGGY